MGQTYTLDEVNTFKQASIIHLACENTHLRRASHRELMGACPFCGGVDRFHVKVEENIWFCRQCSPKWGDSISYVMKRDERPFAEACAFIARGEYPKVDLKPYTPEEIEPSPEWQEMAEKAIQSCESELWEKGGKIVEHLTKRGLKEETLRKYRIGFNVKPQEIEGLYVDRGIIIPWLSGGKVTAIKIRSTGGEPKYKWVKGGVPVLFGLKNLKGKSIVFQTEGEFDAMLLDQEAGDSVGVFTLGSASSRMSDSRIKTAIGYARRLFVAMDNDEAGELAADSICETISKARRAIPLTKGKDITEAWQAGANLKAWVNINIQKDARTVPSKPVDYNDDMSFAEFLKSGRVMLFDSKKLGDKMVLMKDGYCHIPEKWSGYVTYTMEEVALLKGKSDEHLKMVHECKRGFDGSEIIEEREVVVI